MVRGQFVTKALSACQHTLSGIAQAHLSHLAWCVMSRDVPKDDVRNVNAGKDHHRHDRVCTRR